MSVGLLGALVAALAYGSATVLQAVGVRRWAASVGRTRRERLTTAVPYAVGLALDGVGFLASLLALRTMPLFVVESAIASSVAVTAALSAVALRQRLRRPAGLAVGVLIVGLVALAVSALEGPARRLPAATGWGVLAAAAAPAALLLFGSRSRGRRRRSAVLAAAAGLAFGGVGIAARVLVVPSPWWHVLGEPLGWAVAAYGALGTVAYAVALESGAATMVAAVTFGVETVGPAAVGLAWLGDRLRPGTGWLGAAGFVLTLGAAIALAGRAEVADLGADGTGVGAAAAHHS